MSNRRWLRGGMLATEFGSLKMVACGSFALGLLLGAAINEPQRAMDMAFDIFKLML